MPCPHWNDCNIHGIYEFCKLDGDNRCLAFKLSAELEISSALAKSRLEENLDKTQEINKLKSDLESTKKEAKKNGRLFIKEAIDLNEFQIEIEKLKIELKSEKELSHSKTEETWDMAQQIHEYKKEVETLKKEKEYLISKVNELLSTLKSSKWLKKDFRKNLQFIKDVTEENKKLNSELKKANLKIVKSISKYHSNKCDANDPLTWCKECHMADYRLMRQINDQLKDENTKLINQKKLSIEEILD